jgi:hypothetical protein
MYTYSIDTKENVILVEFEGDISVDDYRRLLTEWVESPDFQISPKVLIDQRRGRMTVSVEDARTQPMWVERLQDRLGEPRVAVVTSSDLDFGMNRMFEISSEDLLSHTGKVFRDIAEAREWLGIGDSEE